MEPTAVDMEPRGLLDNCSRFKFILCFGWSVFLLCPLGDVLTPITPAGLVCLCFLAEGQILEHPGTTWPGVKSLGLWNERLLLSKHTPPIIKYRSLPVLFLSGLPDRSSIFSVNVRSSL